MATEHITSRSNPTIRQVRSLITRRASRHRERQFIAEGVRVVTTLLEAGAKLDTLLIDAARQEHAPARLVEQMSDAGARIRSVESKLFNDLSDTETPQPILAVFHMPEVRVAPNPTMVVVLDGVADPGNAGTIIRSGVAFGVDALVFLQGSVDPFNPKVVRSSAGTICAVPMILLDDLTSVVEAFEPPIQAIYIADPHQGRPVDEVDWGSPTVVVLGSEALGPSDMSRRLATDALRVPMRAGTESLNVAAAATVILYEAFRSRAQGARLD